MEGERYYPSNQQTVLAGWMAKAVELRAYRRPATEAVGRSRRHFVLTVHRFEVGLLI